MPPPDAVDSADLPAGPRAHPAVDIITSRRAIMLSTRPVIGLSSWFVDALTRFTPAGLVLTVVTGPTARITLPVRALASALVIHWVVQVADDEFYDGMDGRILTFDGTEFVPTTTPASTHPLFSTVPPPQAWQLLISLTVEHRPSVHTQLGGAIEAVARAFTGTAPGGWGLHEPASEPWNRAELTAVVRRRMPEDTQLVVVGDAPDTLVASIRVERTDRGVEESVECLVNVGPTSRPLTQIRQAAHQLLVDVGTAETIGFAWAHVRPGSTDLGEMAHERAMLIPVGVLIGPRAVRNLGREQVLRAPLPNPVAVGRPRVPGVCWQLGTDDVPAWEQLAELVTYLGPQRIVAVAPQLATGLGVG